MLFFDAEQLGVNVIFRSWLKQLPSVVIIIIIIVIIIIIIIVIIIILLLLLLLFLILSLNYLLVFHKKFSYVPDVLSYVATIDLLFVFQFIFILLYSFIS